jgi:thiosulfate dehydrogenase [quinone] large subunit
MLHNVKQLTLGKVLPLSGGDRPICMGSSTYVQDAPTGSVTETGDQQGVSSRPQDSEAPNPPSRNLRAADWLFRSSAASLIWLVVRLWLGYQWANAGYQKIWGSERSVFWFGGGAGVKGFATAGISGSATGKGGASYGWWAGFLHNFVLPNASWIAKVIAVSEVAIGIALILGLLTGLASIGALLLNLIYMFTGSAGVNPAYAVLAVFLILAWRNAGSLGLDRFALSSAWKPNQATRAGHHASHRRASISPPVPTH